MQFAKIKSAFFSQDRYRGFSICLSQLLRNKKKRKKEAIVQLAGACEPKEILDINLLLQ